MTREACVKSSPTVQLKKAAVCLDSANRDSLSSPVMAEGRGGKKRGRIIFSEIYKNMGFLIYTEMFRTYLFNEYSVVYL